MLRLILLLPAAQFVLCRHVAIYTQEVGLGASKGKGIESLSNGGHSSYNDAYEVAYNEASY